MCIAVFGGILAIMKLIYALALPTDKLSKLIIGFVHKYILWIGFGLSSAALISSLIYSDVIGYPPCMFCWWARVMFYPQVILFSRAIIKRDRSILPYAFIMTSLGLVIGIYHSIIQITGEGFVPCTVGGVSCVTRDVFMFGFITIPLMGAIGFAVLFLSLLISKRASK